MQAATAVSTAPVAGSRNGAFPAPSKRHAPPRRRLEARAATEEKVRGLCRPVAVNWHPSHSMKLHQDSIAAPRSSIRRRLP